MNNGDDKDYTGDDDYYYKIFIADRRFRYSLLYSVLGFFAATLLEPYSKSKKATRWTLTISQGGRSWQAFGERKITPQSFRRARICKFSRQKRCFLQLRKCWYFLL